MHIFSVDALPVPLGSDLCCANSIDRSFDICSEDGEANWDLNELLTSMVKDCNYTINSQLNT